MAIGQIDHVGITVPDLEAAIAFLADAFGCEKLCRIGPFAADDDWMTRRLCVDRAARFPQIAAMGLGQGFEMRIGGG